ncbi:MAG: hypothetical protein LQ349_001678 [Xanthoria aureola]|nr:MAG: hypothetical protein LQ349_001678 [Xanthoria aureola]
MTVAWMAGILVFTGIIPFFAYIFYKGRTVAGKVEFRVSLTAGLPNTGGNRTVSNDGDPNGPAPNPRTSHTASGQELTTSITNTGASAVHGNPSQGPIATPASAFPVTASSTNTGTSSIHRNLPQTQQPTQTGAPRLNSRNMPGNGTGTHTAPSQSPGAWTTGASHDTSRRRNGVGVDYHPSAW